MYNFQKIEAKWQKKWRSAEVFKTPEIDNRPKRYILDMFPYPSGSGLHVGHVESYVATDIYSRFSRGQGYRVLHPQGFDAFGLPAENYAIKTGTHPTETIKTAVEVFTKQIDSLGISYDWDRRVITSDPEYYRFTQWFFLLMHKKGLAYKKKAKVNWCESCQTVLAREQAENSVCERCGTKVIQKDLEQWFFKITDFIEDQEYEGRKISGLLSGLDNLDWPESTKAGQRHWLGRSVGARVNFTLLSSGQNEFSVDVFTTRLDTIFACTYLVLAPEHPLVTTLLSEVENSVAVNDYLKQVSKKTELERTDLNKDKTGIPLLGVTAVNPFNHERIPVFVADYVLASYGTGAVMAVPAHDERDHDFAQKHQLPIKISIWPEDRPLAEAEVFTADGLLVDSGEYTGLNSPVAQKRMIDFLKRTHQGGEQVNYRLRDWLVSRQRYWGAPIPIIYCDQCGAVPVPEKDLPILLPDDVDFRPTGESPLKNSSIFHQVNCPKCQAPARRESDTMDTFVCSSWYFLRYVDPRNEKVFADSKKLKEWLPVDLYFGGAEHTVLHLLYARFFTKVLRKYGFLDFDEPFLRLRHQGIILGEDGNKMSKSKGNVVNPDDLVTSFGADALRMYEMFMGPLEEMKPWSSQGISGLSRFLNRVERIFTDSPRLNDEMAVSLLQQTIKKVTDDIENFKFNTAISALMILVNYLYETKNKNGQWPLENDNLAKFLRLLEPFAPHLAEELWERLGEDNFLALSPWPTYQPELLREETFVLAVQVNGKLRASLTISVELDQEEIVALVKKDPNVSKWLKEAEIIREIYIPKKLLNLVIKQS